MRKKVAPRKKKTIKEGRQKKQQISMVFNEQIWPCERDVLFRPDRLKYVRKLLPPEGCVFCRAAEMGVCPESLCVHRSEHSMVIINKFPYNTGHVLVLPKRHCGDLLDFSTVEFMDLQHLIRRTLGILRQVYSPEGFNLGLNLGAVAGAGIPQHLHYHLIPRWSGDLNFFPLIAETKVVIESPEISFQRLVGYFQ